MEMPSLAAWQIAFCSAWIVRMQCSVSGRVVWITPADAQGKRAQGVGVQFSADEAGRSAKKKIEGLLAGMLDGTKLTHTF